MTTKYVPFSPEDFPFDDCRAPLTFIDSELLLLAIEEKERQKRAYTKECNDAIRRIISELKRRERLKSHKDNTL